MALFCISKYNEIGWSGLRSLAIRIGGAVLFQFQGNKYRIYLDIFKFICAENGAKMPAEMIGSERNPF